MHMGSRSTMFVNMRIFVVSPSFEPTKGSQLAYVLGKQVQVVETVNWSKTVTLKDDKVNFFRSYFHFRRFCLS